MPSRWSTSWQTKRAVPCENRSSATDSELRCGDAEAHAEVVNDIGPENSGVQLGDDSPGVLGLGWKVEGCSDFCGGSDRLSGRCRFRPSFRSASGRSRAAAPGRRGREVPFETVAGVQRRGCRWPRRRPGIHRAPPARSPCGTGGPRRSSRSPCPRPPGPAQPGTVAGLTAARWANGRLVGTSCPTWSR